jgi:DNA-binding winged helix-turn-helix (wHTH) protein
LAEISGTFEIERRPSVRVRFGEFVFDGDARELARGERRVELSPKAFLLLEALLSARPRAMSRAELNDRLWPGTAMGYTSLAGVVAELRKALHDDRSEFHFLRTVHRFGYAFSGEASDEPLGPRASFCCALSWEGREIGLVEGENVIGRDEECAVRIDSPRVSRRHTSIRVRGKEATIEDLGSKNGTFLRGRKLTAPADLEDGDEIGIGGARLTFRAAYGPGSTLTGTRSS